MVIVIKPLFRSYRIQLCYTSTLGRDNRVYAITESMRESLINFGQLILSLFYFLNLLHVSSCSVVSATFHFMSIWFSLLLIIFRQDAHHLTSHNRAVYISHWVLFHLDHHRGMPLKTLAAELAVLKRQVYLNLCLPHVFESLCYNKI